MFTNEDERLNTKGQDLGTITSKMAASLPNHILIVIDPQDDLVTTGLNDRIIVARILGPKGEKTNLRSNILDNSKENKAKGMALQQVSNYVIQSLLTLSVKRSELRKRKKELQEEPKS